MCPECLQLICVCSCPEAGEESPSRGKAYLRCCKCHEPLYAGDVYYSVVTRAICMDCLRSNDFGFLLNFFCHDSPEELFRELGAVRRVVREVDDD